MELKNKSDTFLVSFNHTHGDIPVLIVGRKGKGEIDIINAFQGDEAKELYQKLTVRKEKVMDFKIIAVDFDGTLCENKWPEIGAPNKELISYLKEQNAAGTKLILWTCRVGEILENAVKWSAEQGLVFDAVNENLPEVIEFMGGDTRKIFANEYIDDRNFGYRPAGLISEEMSQSDRMELWGRLIDVVEDWLEEKGITVDDIPNDERGDAEDAAIIFDDDYDYLADRFSEVIGISRDCIGEV